MRTSIYSAKLVWNIHGPVDSALQILARKKERAANRTRNKKPLFLSILTAYFSSLESGISAFHRFSLCTKIQQKNNKRKNGSGNKTSQHGPIINSKIFYFNQQPRTKRPNLKSAERIKLFCSARFCFTDRMV